MEFELERFIRARCILQINAFSIQFSFFSPQNAHNLIGNDQWKVRLIVYNE